MPALLFTLLMLGGAASEAQAQDALKFFKNYFITGDYVAAGVALRNTGGSGVIDLTSADVPEGADIVGAFLYWQTVLRAKDGELAGTVGATFEGQPLSFSQNGATVSVAKAVNPSGSAPCWSSGGSTGASKGTHKSVTYRTDVLRYLQDPDTPGKINVRRTFALTLPDAGKNGNTTPSTSGATLVVIYRHPSKPLRSIVLWDGGFTLDNSRLEMRQTLTGFFDAADPASPSGLAPAARMTHIVADGQTNFPDRLLFNGVALGDNLFNGPAWDTLTLTGLPLDPHAASATLRVSPIGSSVDCLSWSALVFSTNVQDTDEDGLLDKWESSDALLPDPNAGCTITATSPAACFLPNLRAMGADPNAQDVFIELGSMTTGGYKRRGSSSSTPEEAIAAHRHRPSRQVLEAVAAVFAAAPPRPRRFGAGAITGPIRLHFDGGSSADYQSGLPTVNECRNVWQASCAIIPTAAGARGGEEIDESVGCRSAAGGFTVCGGDFPNYPGTVGWKSGFQLLKNQPLYKLAGSSAVPFTLGNKLPSLEEQCLAAGTACVRRFDRNRKDIFRYALFAHALGLVRVDADGDPVLDSTGAKQPKNTSGIADGGGVGGGDLMVTLGLWDNSVGKTFLQGSTLLHEIGHTLGLRHGGGAPAVVAGQPVAQPNCKPNYQSIMNYMFQVRGLVGPSGVPTLDLSRQVLGDLNEGALAENLTGAAGWSQMTYRTSWFAPLTNPFLAQVIAPATRQCDGSPLKSAEKAFRVDGTTQNGLIDWNWDGTIGAIGLTQDINFNNAINNGGFGTDALPKLTFQGYNDFASMDLRQLPSRRNAGSARLDGALSIDVGFGDVGFGDVGFGDVGFGDVGFGDVGFGDVGFGDVGFGDVGFGDVGFGDVGFGDVGFGDAGAPEGELDLEIAAELNGPNSLAVTRLNANGPFVLNWTAPHIGTVESYTVYKAVGSVITPTTPIAPIGNVTPTTPGDRTTVVDQVVTPGVTYIYFVVARLTDGTLTPPSNFVTMTR